MNPRTLAILFILFVLLAGCSAPPSGDLALCDLETGADLDKLHWKCHVLYSLSAEHSTHGSRSLKMELYPSEYPGLSPRLVEKDWRGFKNLAFDIYNPGEKEVRLTVRIDDRKETPEYGDRYNETFNLKPGPNKMVKELGGLKTSDSKRRLNLGKITRFMMFVVKPEEKITLFVDNIRLVK